MILTDTHTHLYSEEFGQDRDAMIKRAIDAGVTRFFVPSIDSSYTQQMLDLEKQALRTKYSFLGRTKLRYLKDLGLNSFLQ